MNAKTPRKKSIQKCPKAGLWLGLVCTLWALCWAAPHALASEKEVRILASTFPVYQLTRNITDQVPKVHVDLMIPAASGCPHDYSLTPQDMRKLAQADILVINGLGLEEFLKPAIQQVGTSLQVIDSSQDMQSNILPMAPRHGTHRHGPQYNPHLYVSPAMSAHMALALAKQLAKLDPANAAIYQKNGQTYSDRLHQLAGDLRSMGTRLNKKKIVSQDEVFAYLMRDTGLHVVISLHAHEGPDPSASELIALVREIKYRQADAVFTEPQYADNIGATVAREANIPIAVLDPVSSGPENVPLDYYEQVMRKNLNSLEQTLNGKRSRN